MASKSKSVPAKKKPSPAKASAARVPAKKLALKKSVPAPKKPVAVKKSSAPKKSASAKKPAAQKKPAAPQKKKTPPPQSAKKKPVPAKKASKPAAKPSAKKSVPAAKKSSVPAKKPSAAKPAPKAKTHAAKLVPAKKNVPAKAPAKPAAKSVPAKKPAAAPSAKKSSPKEKSPAPKSSSKKSASAAAKNNPLAGIVVRRDAETVQTKIITRRRGFIAYTPKELELMFLRRGNADINLFNPETAEKPAARPAPATKQILTALPKAKPRKIGAVSLDDLFGYNPFAKNSVSAEEKLIPQKWMRYYKKLVALKAALQKEIDEHSQTAFSREGKEDTGDISASYSQHTADIDNEAFTRDCALSLLASKQQELSEINIAIERMKKGTYGICEITGRPIPAERLRDVPFTRFSIEGKIEAEKQRRAAARRRRAAAATDIASVTDLENDVPIVFSEDDEADRKKAAGEPNPEDEEK